LSKNSLYGIIGVLFVLLLSGILYWLLSKRQKSDKIDVIEQLSKTKSSIEESLIKEFSKQTQLIDANLKLIDLQTHTHQKSTNKEIDHSLALKVADQIVTIERAIGNKWLITSGINNNDKIIIEGLNKVKTGDKIEKDI